MHKENSLDLEAGGLFLRLNFHDPERHRELQAAFPCLPGKQQRPVGTIAVHSPESANGWRFDVRNGKPFRYVAESLPIPTKYPQGKTIDGDGQYDGMFDLNARTGYVTIDGPSAELVLANFVRQVFTHLIIAHGGVILHSACVVKNGNAHIFYGTSGAGKSTICELSPDCAIASDDLIAIRKIGNRFLAWGMPGNGVRSQKSEVRSQRSEVGGQRSEVRNSRGPFEIKALFRLVQDTTNHLTPLSGAKAVADILALPRTPIEPARITKMLEFLDKLTDHIPSYELHFRKDTSFWKCIEKEFGVSP